MKQPDLIIYGAIADDFAKLAGYRKMYQSAITGDLKYLRVDCWELPSIPVSLRQKFSEVGIQFPRHLEIFNPSTDYPPHKDEGGISYFIPLESGIFTIKGVSYPVVPFVLYAFEDGELHNTDFCAIMLK